MNTHASKTICLCMMVRNEAKIIRRALESVLPLIDYWVIADTGSDDDTNDIVLDVLRGIPGELHESVWVNFGHNRTEIVQKAHGKADYLLIMDADMVANVYAPFKHKLIADAYEIRYEGDIAYTQHMLVAAHHDWRYVGVTHEYIDTPTRQTVDWLHELTLTHLADGGMRSSKFERDIALLTESLRDDPHNPRTFFYLGQSYKDLGRYAEALPWYQQRASMDDTWEEERWYAQMQSGRMQWWCNYPQEIVVDSLLRAHEMRPWRMEAIYTLAVMLHQRQSWNLLELFTAFVEKGIPYPDKDILFIEKHVYDYQLLYIYGVGALANGNYQQAATAFNKVLSRDDLPAATAASAQETLSVALNALFPTVAQPAAIRHRFAVIPTNHSSKL